MHAGFGVDMVEDEYIVATADLGFNYHVSRDHVDLGTLGKAIPRSCAYLVGIR